MIIIMIIIIIIDICISALSTYNVQKRFTSYTLIYVTEYSQIAL